MNGTSRKDGAGGVDRLWDSQWVNIVNAPQVLNAESQDDAVNIAVRMTEQKMAENARLRDPAGVGGEWVLVPRERLEQVADGITDIELGWAMKRATPAQVIEYLADDVNMSAALSLHFDESRPAPPSAPVGVEAPADEFNGDTPHLIRCIESLLRLDAACALVPHGVGGHARTMLAAAAKRLAQQPAAVDGVCGDACAHIAIERDMLKANNERLAEALRDVMGWVSTDNYFTDEPMRALARARAALEQEKGS